jgi:hypothetical protein
MVYSERAAGGIKLPSSSCNDSPSAAKAVVQTQ